MQTTVHLEPEIESSRSGFRWSHPLFCSNSAFLFLRAVKVGQIERGISQLPTAYWWLEVVNYVALYPWCGVWFTLRLNLINFVHFYHATLC